MIQNVVLAPELVTGVLMVLGAAATFWFVGGAIRNRNRAAREMTRLSPLLERLGANREGRWLAPGTLRIGVERGRGSIARAAVVLLLEPRELGGLWLVQRWRGRRDVLVVRCELRRAPTLTAELFRDSGAVAREVRAALDRSRVALEPERRFPGGIVALAEKGGGALVDELWEIWSERATALLRVAVHPTAPQLVLAFLLGAEVDWSDIAEALTRSTEMLARKYLRRP